MSRNVLGYIWLACLFAACAKDIDPVYYVRPHYYAQVVELWDNGRKNAYLKLETYETFGCTDDTLTAVSFFDRNTLVVQVGEKPDNNPCPFSRARLSITFLLPEGKMHIPIQLVLPGKIISNGLIIETDHSYTLDIEKSKGILVKNSETFKIKQQLIWGYVYPKSVELANQLLVESFIYNIESRSSNAMLKPGFYSYFSLDADGKIIWEYKPDIFKMSDFCYAHNLSTNELNSYLEELQERYGKIIGYRVQTGNGRIIESK